MLRYLLFDLDGTLTDPAMGITNSIIYALGKLDREIPPRESLYRFIGPPLVPAFQEFIGMSEEEARYAMKLYREYYAVKGLFENEVYPGIPAALDALKKSGFRLFTATSKPEKFAAQILEHFSLDGYFDSICGATMDEKRVTKTDVIKFALSSNGITDASAENTLMIGDRKHDIIGAKECGLSSMGVLWGYGSAEELKDSGAGIIVNTPEEMVKIISDM